MFLLNGKVALVTGASRGIGKGIAISLAKAGANVIVNYFGSKASAEEVVAEIKSYGRDSIAIHADVSNELDVKNMFKGIIEHFGRLDILINNAGTTRSEDIFDIELENWNKIINTNLTSAFLCSKEAMKIMRDQHYGKIVQISSIVAHQGSLKGHIHYTSSKSGQLGFTKTLARTGFEYGINVNAIAPGIIGTELLESTFGEDGVKKLAEGVPLGLGTVEDVGNATIFLCSDEAKYITGVTLDVNGGMYLR